MALLPTGVTAPMPVTTTLCSMFKLLLGVRGTKRQTRSPQARFACFRAVGRDGASEPDTLSRLLARYIAMPPSQRMTSPVM